MKQLAILNPEEASEEEVKGYDVRETGRAIVIDEDGKVGLLHVTKDSYYKTPGGGVEEGEDKIAALKRECQEELGCDVEVIGEVGMIVEYRKMFNLQQISYCYLAKPKGNIGTLELTQEEADKGFQPVWLSYDDALKALVNSAYTDSEAKYYIVPRDTIFLKEAKELLNN